MIVSFILIPHLYLPSTLLNNLHVLLISSLAIPSSSPQRHPENSSILTFNNHFLYCNLNASVSPTLLNKCNCFKCSQCVLVIFNSPWAGIHVSIIWRRRTVDSLPSIALHQTFHSGPPLSPPWHPHSFANPSWSSCKILCPRIFLDMVAGWQTGTIAFLSCQGTSEMHTHCNIHTDFYGSGLVWRASVHRGHMWFHLGSLSSSRDAPSM